MIGQTSTITSRHTCAGAHAVYTRMEFTVDGAADIRALQLRLKYDNGFIAYLNGIKVAEENIPAKPSWFSTAPNNAPRDAQAIVPAEFDLTPHVARLVDGRNVLAIHGLNNTSDDTDMLLSAELIADQAIRQSALGYLPTATPGAANFVLNAITGPLIRSVTENPGAIDDRQDLVVTAVLQAQNAPVAEASLVYRVMYDSPVTVSMLDDGLGPDAAAGDGVYSAAIPHTAAGPGQMVRWQISASDVQGNWSIAPVFHDREGTRQSAEYYGTIVADPSLSDTLPVFHWFTQDKAGAHGRNGARAAVFYDNEFYDNVSVRQRGGYTNASVSQKFTFNRDHQLRVNQEMGRVREINVNGPGSDPSYVRQPLAFDAYQAAGNQSSESFLINMRLNGEADRVGVFIEQVDEDFLRETG